MTKVTNGIMDMDLDMDMNFDMDSLLDTTSAGRDVGGGGSGGWRMVVLSL